MSTVKSQIDLSKLPKHVAVIMDGNGRWAEEKGLSRIDGHKNGVKSVRDIAEAAAELNIPYLTLYAFSTENWSRPKIEVNALMELLVETIKIEVSTLNENNIKLNTIGDIDSLPQNCQYNLKEAMDATSKNSGMTLILALSYSAKWDILNATKSIAKNVAEQEIALEDVDEKLFNQNLSTKNFPHPELLIRTSGEKRVSNFLLWQIAYSELYFTEVLWPDFSKEEFYKAIVDFQNRERRFGLTSDQINSSKDNY